jgi:hypothetical protein
LILPLSYPRFKYKNAVASKIAVTENTASRHDLRTAGGAIKCFAIAAPIASPQRNPPMWAELSIPGTTDPKNRLNAAKPSKLFNVPRKAVGGTGSFPRYKAAINAPATPKIAPEAPTLTLIGRHHKLAALPANPHAV